MEQNSAGFKSMKRMCHACCGWWLEFDLIAHSKGAMAHAADTDRKDFILFPKKKHAVGMNTIREDC
jgi:hypothetical protein